MAMQVKDAAAAVKTVKTTVNGSTEHIPHHNIDDFADFGKKDDAAAGSDTADTGHISLMKRLLQGITALKALYPSSIGQKNKAGSLSVTVASDQDALPVSAAALPLPTGASTSAKQDTGNTSLASIDTKLSNVPAKGQATMANSTPVVIASDHSPINVTGKTTLVTGTVTRPNDTIPYVANDVISPTVAALIQVQNCALANGGSGCITHVRIETNKNISVGFKLQLYNTSTGITPVNDNAQFPLLHANNAKRVGRILMPNMESGGTGSDCAETENDDVRKEFKCDAGSRDLWLALIPTGAFTPDANQVFNIEFLIQQY